MRVLDDCYVDVTNDLDEMTGNKRKKRSAAEEKAGNKDLTKVDAAEVVVENGDCKELASPNNSNLKKCTHIKGAFNGASVRKKLKGFSSIVCDKCEKAKSVDENDDVWLCLCCGNRGCGRYSTNQHSLQHFNSSTSVPHALVYNFGSSQVWCYQCDEELPGQSQTQPLKQSIGEIQTRVNNIVKSKNDRSTETAVAAKKPSAAEDNNNSKPSKNAKDKSENLPLALKGLSNLGNTCFFNSVVQNLIQTHYLDEILESGRLVKGTSVVLRPFLYSDNLFGVDTPEDQKSLYGPLTVTLNDDLGSLTKSLCSIFKEFKSSKSQVISPSSLFSEVCKKAPRFKGFQQQDSHELLRYLLDALRNEEQRRLRLALLGTFDFNKNVKPDTMNTADKTRLKVYDRAADVTCVEQVFGGQLIQCIKCLECGNSSVKLESFLDLSLPIAENKTSLSNNVVTELGNDFLQTLKAKSGKSKYMVKKEKKQARKGKNGGNDKSRRKNSVNSQEKTDVPIQETDIVAPQNDSHHDILQNGLCVGNNDLGSTESPSSLAVNSPSSLALNLEKLSLDESIPKIDDTDEEVKNGVGEPCENGIADINCDNEQNCSSSPSSLDNNDYFVPSAENLHKFMEPLALFSGSTSSSGCHLTSCLAEFMSTETLNGKNKFGCEHCSKTENNIETKGGENVISGNKAVKANLKIVYTDALKQYLIYSPPAVLTLHLKRFHQLGGSFRKINKHVDFPLVLDLAPYCSKYGSRLTASDNRVLYSLYGVVSHSGRLSGGHYVAYVKVREKTKHLASAFLQSGPSGLTKSVDLNKNIVPVQTISPVKAEPSEKMASLSDGKWYYISDSYVTEVAENKVLNAEAYLLFYERVL